MFDVFFFFSHTTQSIAEKETQNFKWWPRLHGYWHTLPNFNPYTVSSNPGQNLVDEALLVLMGGHGCGDPEPGMCIVSVMSLMHILTYYGHTPFSSSSFSRISCHPYYVFHAHTPRSVASAYIASPWHDRALLLFSLCQVCTTTTVAKNLKIFEKLDKIRS